MIELGLYIKHLRTLSRWSLRELARQSGVNASTLSRIEHGHDCTLSRLVDIAGAFGLGAGDLLVAAGYTSNLGEPRIVAASSADYMVRVTTINGVAHVEIIRDGSK